MYFFKYQPLKEKLRARSVSDREALPHFLLFSLGMMIPGLLPSAYEYNYWDYIGSFICAVITLVGIFYAYQKNDGKDGYDFIHKYVVLCWVVLVRFTICFILILILFIFIGISAGLHSSKATGPYMVIIISLSQILFYQRLGKHIRDTIKPANQSNRTVHP